MAVTVSGVVTASIPVAGVVTLTYTAVDTGLGSVTSRILTIFDCNGNLLDTITMSGLTAQYNITADGYFMFTQTVTDGTGTYTGDTNYVSTAFYINAFVLSVAGINSQCTDIYGTIMRQSQAQNNRYAAVDAGLFGQGVVAQNLITYANFLITTPYYFS